MIAHRIAILQAINSIPCLAMAKGKWKKHLKDREPKTARRQWAPTKIATGVMMFRQGKPLIKCEEIVGVPSSTLWNAYKKAKKRDNELQCTFDDPRVWETSSRTGRRKVWTEEDTFFEWVTCDAGRRRMELIDEMVAQELFTTEFGIPR